MLSRSYKARMTVACEIQPLSNIISCQTLLLVGSAVVQRLRPLVTPFNVRGQDVRLLADKTVRCDQQQSLSKPRLDSNHKQLSWRCNSEIQQRSALKNDQKHRKANRRGPSILGSWRCARTSTGHPPSRPRLRLFSQTWRRG